MCRTKDLSLDQSNQSQKSNVSRPKGKGHKNFVKAMAYEEIDSENEYIFNIGNRPSNSELNMQRININSTSVKCLIDSGATCNIMSENMFQRLKGVQLQPCNVKLFPYGVNKCLNVKGKSYAKIEVADRSIFDHFIVVSNNCESLLGDKSAKELGILKIEDPSSVMCAHVNKENCDYSVHFDDLKDKKCFKGFGKLNNFQLQLHIDDNVKPVAQPLRRVPFSMRKNIEEKLEEFISLDVIEPVEGPAAWVSPPVFVPKGGDVNDIRICLDMRRVNEAIQRS